MDGAFISRAELERLHQHLITATALKPLVEKLLSESDDDRLTAKQVAEMKGCKVDTVRHWFERYEGLAEKQGKTWTASRIKVDEFFRNPKSFRRRSGKVSPANPEQS